MRELTREALYYTAWAGGGGGSEEMGGIVSVRSFLMRSPTATSTMPSTRWSQLSAPLIAIMPSNEPEDTVKRPRAPMTRYTTPTILSHTADCVEAQRLTASRLRPMARC